MSVNTRVQCLLKRVRDIRSELAGSDILPLGGLALPPLTGIALHSAEDTGYGRRRYQQPIPPRPIFPPGTSSHKKEQYTEMVELLSAASHLSDPSALSTPHTPTSRVQRYLGDHHPDLSVGGDCCRGGRYISFEDAWLYYVAVFEGMAACCVGQSIQIALEPVGPMACCAPFFICSSRKSTATSNRQPSTPLRFLLSTPRPVPPTSLLHALQRHLLSTNAAHSTYTPTTSTTANISNITGLNLLLPLRPSLSSVYTPQCLIPCEVEVVPYYLLYARVLLDSSPPELLYHCFRGAHERGLTIHRIKGIRVARPELAKPHLSACSGRDGGLQVVPTSLRELVDLLGVTALAERHYPFIVS